MLGGQVRCGTPVAIRLKGPVVIQAARSAEDVWYSTCIRRGKNGPNPI